jgi:hypothetical protein
MVEAPCLWSGINFFGLQIYVLALFTSWIISSSWNQCFYFDVSQSAPPKVTRFDYNMNRKDPYRQFYWQSQSYHDSVMPVETV